MDPWRTKPLQIADLSWQVEAVFLYFLRYKFYGSFFLSGDIPNVLRDGPVIFLGVGEAGEGGLGQFAKKKTPALQKLKNNPAKGGMKEKIEQLLFTIQVLC